VTIRLQEARAVGSCWYGTGRVSTRSNPL